MWISRKKWRALEKRVADLEINQTKSANMVKDYIRDSENLANQLTERITRLPEILEEMLNNYGLGK